MTIWTSRCSITSITSSTTVARTTSSTKLLLKLGLDLCVPIETRAIADTTVRSVGAGTLICCLADKIDREAVEPLALGIAEWRAELAPAGETTVIFRDSAFADDVAKTNLTAILEQHGLGNVRSL